MPIEVRRKIIEVGDGGRAVTLPKPWLRFWGLDKGGDVEVIGDSVLIIVPPNLPPEKREKLRRAVMEV